MTLVFIWINGIAKILYCKYAGNVYGCTRVSVYEDLPFSRRGGEAFNPFTPEDMRVVSVAMQPR